MQCLFRFFRRAGLVSAISSVWLFGSVIAERIDLLFADDTPQVLLPESVVPDEFRLVEWSTNLTDWETVTRDYGEDWETVFPHTLPVSTGAVAAVLTDSIGGHHKYYRYQAIQSDFLDNTNSVARFLQQSTFGPTRSMIASFPGLAEPTLNNPPYTNYAAWIDTQISLPTNSLRAFWRERSNPAYTNNPANAHLYEVGHNPAYGRQLTYFTYNGTNQVKHVADTNDAIAVGRKANDVLFGAPDTKKIVWYQLALTADDALRQRMAWALSQIFVLGESGSNQLQSSERWLAYYDIFVRNAFGSFRDILGEVTYSPHMGYYLTYTGNRKANLSKGTFPDENYAREVMQLFSIGLWLLNQDGSLISDENGEPVPAYDNEDIKDFSRVFTGLLRQDARNNLERLGKNDNYIDPMRINVNRHDFDPKILLNGSTLGPFPETEAGVRADIDGLLDHLFNHPNTPPFISRLLIQRFTVSNPSPNYIHDVAQAFVDGSYQGSGSGQRGDLGAVIRAILLHPEAREPALALDAAHGRLREPLTRLLSCARAFDITSVQTYGLLPFQDMDVVLAQAPFDSPSVFNFYLPDYQPPGEVLKKDLFAPEFQIHNDITALSLPNAIRVLVYDGVEKEIGFRYYHQAELDLTYETGLASDSGALLDHLDTMLCAGRLTADNRSLIAAVIDGMPSGSDAELEARVQRAISLFAILPEFNVLF